MINTDEYIKQLKEEITKLRAENELLSNSYVNESGELRDTKEILRLLESNLESILENTKDSVWAINTNYDIIYINTIFRNEFKAGFGVELKNGSNILQSLPTEIKEIWKSRYDRTFAGESYQIEDAVPTILGNIYIEISFNPIYKDDKIVGASFFARNITDRKNILLKLEESEEKYRTLADNISDVVWITDLQMNVKYISPSIYGLTGETPDEHLSKPIFMRHPESSLQLLNEIYIQEMQMEKSANVDYNRSRKIEIEYYKANGETVWTELNVSFIRDEKNNPVGIQGITRDISKRKEYQDKLIKNEKIFREYAETVDAIFWRYDPSLNKWLYVSEQCIKILGYPPEEWLDFDWWADKIHPVDRDRTINFCLSRTEMKESHSMTYRMMHKNGNYIWIYDTVSLEIENDKVKYLYGLMIDISDIKKKEEELRKLNNAISNSNDIIFTTDKDGIITFINPEFTNVYGFSNEEVVGKATPRILKSGLSSPEQIEYIWHQLTNKQSIFGEYVNRRKDGSLIDIEGSAQPILDEHNEILGYLGIQRDITERKRVESELRHSEELHRGLLQTVPDLIIRTDLEGNINFVNDYTFDSIDFVPKEKLIGKNILSFIAQKDLQRAIDNTKLMIESPLGLQEYELNYLDTFTLFVEVNGDVIRDEHNIPTGMVYVIRDITKRKHVENELINTKIKALESEKLKTAFLQNISHEIRTPLNGIMGFSKIITEYSISHEEKTEYTKLLNQSCNRLMNTVNDILDIARIDTEQVEIRKHDFKAIEVLSDLLMVYKDSFREKSISLEINSQTTHHSIIYNDQKSIFQILNAFLSNAYKFTLNGSVELGYELTQEEIVFYVKDSGTGISHDKLDKIFDRFYQGDTSFARGYEGSGLGLSIAKGLANLIGGRVYAESQPGIGSTFYLALPLN